MAKQEEHHFPGIYKNKRVWFDTERLDGYAWEVDEATVMFRFAYKNIPDAYLYESIFLSPCNNYRFLRLGIGLKVIKFINVL